MSAARARGVRCRSDESEGASEGAGQLQRCRCAHQQLPQPLGVLAANSRGGAGKSQRELRFFCVFWRRTYAQGDPGGGTMVMIDGEGVGVGVGAGRCIGSEQAGRMPLPVDDDVGARPTGVMRHLMRTSTRHQTPDRQPRPKRHATSRSDIVTIITIVNRQISTSPP